MPQKNYPPFHKFTITDYDHEKMRQELISFKYLERMIQQAHDEPIEEGHDNMKGYFSTFKASNWPHHFPYTLRIQKKLRDKLLPLLPGIEITDNYLIAPRDMSKFKGGEFSQFVDESGEIFPFHSDKWEGLMIPRYLDDYDLGDEDSEEFNVLDHIQRIEGSNKKDNFSNKQTVAVAGFREVIRTLDMRGEDRLLFKEMLLSDEEINMPDPEGLFISTTRMKQMFRYCIKHSTGTVYEDDMIPLMIEFVDKETPNTRENIEAFFAQKPKSNMLAEALERQGIYTFGDMLESFFRGCPSLTLNFIIPSEEDVTPEESGDVEIFDKDGNVERHNYRTGLLRIEHYHRVVQNKSRTCLQTYIYGASYDEVYEAMEKIDWTF